MAVEINPDGVIVNIDSVAVDSLNELLSSLPGYADLTESMKSAALAGALVPDAWGVWPGEEGYTTTYDNYFAALSLVNFLKARPQVTNASSEGTGVSVTPPDWKALSDYYRSQSQILRASGPQVLTSVSIPDTAYLERTDMTGRGTHYGNIDTDIG